MATYPMGYGTQEVTMQQMRAKHEPHMHPAFARRLFPWLETQNGKFGIGGGFRTSQPTGSAFAPDGKSFHQAQQFRSGVYYAAVDLVKRVPGGKHSSGAISWSEIPAQGSAWAKQWGLHMNVGTEPNGEAWHMQPIEIDGYNSWVNAGRPDPAMNYQIPGTPSLPPSGADYGLYPLDPNKATISKGSGGGLVTYLQRVLRDNAQAVTVDGDFGNQTEQGVKDRQAASGLAPDGVVGPATWKVIDKLAGHDWDAPVPAPPPPPKEPQVNVDGLFTKAQPGDGWILVTKRVCVAGYDYSRIKAVNGNDAGPDNGQILAIPTSALSKSSIWYGLEYTVKQGDSCWNLAKSWWGNGANWPWIQKLNGLNANGDIKPGQMLKIPGQAT